MNFVNRRMAPDSMECCDLCIIGTGIAGLNALFVAEQYLDKHARVVVIDRHGSPGGMWTTTYDYARLHQPHPSFTVGDMAWNWSRPPHYLATAREVEAHLAGCYHRLRERLNLAERFGHSVVGCKEIGTDCGAFVRVEYHANDRPGERRLLRAKRVIRATGFDVPAPEPLLLSSQQVRSTTPQRLSRDGILDETAPVYIVGGGKTGLDTAHTLIDRMPGRRVTLIKGKGMMFADRDLLAPRGARRWWAGRPFASVFRDMALRFDGSNEKAVFGHLCRSIGLGLSGTEQQFFFGLLSTGERDAIARGLDVQIDDYLDDVVDGPVIPEMRLRGGGHIPITPGAIFVNCTGQLLRHQHRYEPYLSAGGAMLSINPRSMTHFLSSMAAYTLSHLFLSGKLRDVPLYELDAEALRGVGGQTYHCSAIALTFLNTHLARRALPAHVARRCKLDLDGLYPLLRRLPTMLGATLKGARDIEHCRKALERVAWLHGIRCGLLSQSWEAGNHYHPQRRLRRAAMPHAKTWAMLPA